MTAIFYSGRKGNFSIKDRVLTLEVKCDPFDGHETLEFILPKEIDTPKVQSCLEKANYLSTLHDGMTDYELNAYSGFGISVFRKTIMYIKFKTYEEDKTKVFFREKSEKKNNSTPVIM